MFKTRGSISSSGYSILSSEPVWEWCLFGEEASLIIHITHEVSLWKRFWTMVFFGSKWKRLNKGNI